MSDKNSYLFSKQFLYILHSISIVIMLYITFLLVVITESLHLFTISIAAEENIRQNTTSFHDKNISQQIGFSRDITSTQ